MKKITIYIICLFIFLSHGKSQVVINELMAYNTSTLWNSETGLYSDWIEIHNTGTEIYDLTWCALSDEFDDPGRWIFPTGKTIDPGEYIIIWADDAQQPVSGFHVNFKLEVSGESLYLFNLGTGQILDSISFSRQFENVSYGKNGNGQHVYFANPTPTTLLIVKTQLDKWCYNFFCHLFPPFHLWDSLKCYNSKISSYIASCDV